jgi:hypothetical protein
LFALLSTYTLSTSCSPLQCTQPLTLLLCMHAFRQLQSAVFNTAVFIDKYGKVLGRHRKGLPSFTEVRSQSRLVSIYIYIYMLAIYGVHCLLLLRACGPSLVYLAVISMYYLLVP